jgi:hypothetical protein
MLYREKRGDRERERERDENYLIMAKYYQNNVRVVFTQVETMMII